MPLQQKIIKFDQLNKHSSIKIILLMIAGACLILGNTTFDNTDFEIIKVFTFIIPIVYLGRIFWFKNYVRWNKNIIILKFNYFTDDTIKFVDIYSLERLENKLKITLSSEKVYEFNIDNIKPDHISKLNTIIVENSNAEFYDYRDNNYYEGDCCSIPSRI